MLLSNLIRHMLLYFMHYEFAHEIEWICHIVPPRVKNEDFVKVLIISIYVSGLIWEYPNYYNTTSIKQICIYITRRHHYLIEGTSSLLAYWLHNLSFCTWSVGVLVTQLQICRWSVGVLVTQLQFCRWTVGVLATQLQFCRWTVGVLVTQLQFCKWTVGLLVTQLQFCRWTVGVLATQLHFYRWTAGILVTQLQFCRWTIKTIQDYTGFLQFCEWVNT